MLTTLAAVLLALAVTAGLIRACLALERWTAHRRAVPVLDPDPTGAGGDGLWLDPAGEDTADLTDLAAAVLTPDALTERDVYRRYADIVGAEWARDGEQLATEAEAYIAAVCPPDGGGRDA